jgi:lathosterol oxidase
MNIDDIFLVFGHIYLADLLRYLIPALGLLMILAIAAPFGLNRRRIQHRRARAADLRREFIWSMLTVLIFAINGVGIYLMVQTGGFEIYANIGRYGWPYWIISFIGLVLGHDTYFYWLHRLMHHRLLFRRMHLTHHRSHTPTPLAAYAFSPAEAVVHALYLDLVLVLVPLHAGAIFAFLIFMILRNVIGHAGFELFPRATLSLPLLRHSTTVTHHDLHHSAGDANFGLYFTWWDRWMGTEHPAYARTFAEATAIPEEHTAPAPQ